MSYFGTDLWTAIHKGIGLQYHPIECREKWVAEALKDKIQDWVPCARVYALGEKPLLPEPVMIHAPTGTGKTTFVIDYLSEFAKKQNQCVLILGNRFALNMQYKQALSKKFGYNYGSKALENISIFDNITICTYQSLETFIASNPRFSPLFVVCDETHFFCSDATINPRTEEILGNIMYCFPHSCRIYMSATPEDVKPVIAAAEYLFWKSRHSNPGGFEAFRYQHREIKEYYFSPDYEHISLTFFKSWETIVDQIKISNDLTKWLVFVRRKEDGKELLQKLAADIADYVDSSSKDSDDKILENMARRHKFEKKALICTSVLDNGFSFEDDELKEIVVDFTDFTEIIQSMGRKRVNGDEKVHVHIKIPELNTISKYLTENENLLGVLQDFNRNRLEFTYRRWGRLNEEQQKLFWLRPHGNMVILGSNSIAQYQLGKKCGALERLKDEMMADSDAFAKQICELFRKDFLESMYEDGKRTDEVVRELTVILEEYLDKSIGAGEEMKQLDEKLQDYLERNSMPSKNLKFKKDKNDRSAEHIKQIIKVFSLPFKLSEKANKAYRLLPKDEK